jgi:hypothetical protein
MKPAKPSTPAEDRQAQIATDIEAIMMRARAMVEVERQIADMYIARGLIPPDRLPRE